MDGEPIKRPIPVNTETGKPAPHVVKGWKALPKTTESKDLTTGGNGPKIEWKPLETPVQPEIPQARDVETGEKIEIKWKPLAETPEK